LKKVSKTSQSSKRAASSGASKTVVRVVVSKSSTAKRASKPTKSSPVRSKVAIKPKPSRTKVVVARKVAAKKLAVAARVVAVKKATPRTQQKKTTKSAKTIIKTRTPLPSRSKKPTKVTRRGSASIKVVKQVAPPPLPEPPPRRQPSTGVLKVFEQAVRIFNKRQFADAKELFESLQGRYPQEVEINATAQTYIQVCVQKLARPVSSPRSADELYDRGVVALNVGDFSQARTLFEKALRLRPDEPHLLYSLAATYAQTGSPDEALEYLHRSIQMQPRYRNQVISDADFTQLHNDKRFLEILGVTSPFDLFDSVH
jgi:TolA-binding protein